MARTDRVQRVWGVLKGRLLAVANGVTWVSTHVAVVFGIRRSLDSAGAPSTLRAE